MNWKRLIIDVLYIDGLLFIIKIGDCLKLRREKVSYGDNVLCSGKCGW